VGAINEGGTLEFDLDRPLEVMYLFTMFNAAKYALLVPLVFDCRLGRPIVVIALVYYLVYQAVYVLAVMGLV
jgi:hypothetical protein